MQLLRKCDEAEDVPPRVALGSYELRQKTGTYCSELRAVIQLWSDDFVHAMNSVIESFAKNEYRARTRIKTPICNLKMSTKWFRRSGTTPEKLRIKTRIKTLN